MGEISVKTGNNARNGGKNSLNRLIRCVCGKKIGPDPRNFNQRVSLGRNDLLIRTFLNYQSEPLTIGKANKIASECRKRNEMAEARRVRENERNKIREKQLQALNDAHSVKER
ncbi:hypothetical protein ACNEP1_004662 [Escherichia coli]